MHLETTTMTNTQSIKLLDYHCHLNTDEPDGCLEMDNLQYPFHYSSSCCYYVNPIESFCMNSFDSKQVNSDISDIKSIHLNITCDINSTELLGFESYNINVHLVTKSICTNLLDTLPLNACLPYHSSYQSFDPLLVNQNVNLNNNNDQLLFLPGTILGPVINLSSFQLTPPMISLLSKGLNFCPSPNAPDRYELRKDLDKFHVSLQRKTIFRKEI